MKGYIILLVFSFVLFTRGYSENSPLSYIITPRGETNPLTINKEIIKEFYDGFHENDEKKMAKFLAPTYSIQDATMDYDSSYSKYDAFSKNMVTRMKAMHNALPNFKFTLLEIIAEGNKVVTRIQISGIQRGSFLGVEATNKPVLIKIFSVFTIEDGRIVNIYEMWNDLGVMKHIGAIIL